MYMFLKFKKKINVCIFKKTKLIQRQVHLPLPCYDFSFL